MDEKMEREMLEILDDHVEELQNANNLRRADIIVKAAFFTLWTVIGGYIMMMVMEAFSGLGG